MNIRFTFLVMLVSLFAVTAKAQRIDPAVIAVSGGHVVTPSGSVTWTAGQTAVQTWSFPGGTVAEGFQQAFLKVIPVREQSVPFTLDLFPNPTRHSVLVSLTGMEDDLSLVLFNLLGKPVLRKELRGGERRARLSFETLPSGLYMLVAFSGGGERLAMYKIVKAK